MGSLHVEIWKRCWVWVLVAAAMADGGSEGVLNDAGWLILAVESRWALALSVQDFEIMMLKEESCR